MYTIVTGYDEQTISLCTCASHAINMQTLSHINQWQCPITCTLPKDQSDPLTWSMVILDQSEADKSEWYLYSTPSSVEALFVVQS